VEAVRTELALNMMRIQTARSIQFNSVLAMRTSLEGKPSVL